MRRRASCLLVLSIVVGLPLGCRSSVEGDVREVEVFLPEERSYIVEFVQDEMPGVMNLNRALADFAHREAFAWHLSILIELEDLLERGMPSQAERKVVDAHGELLDGAFKGPRERPNALFVARITWDGTRELIYRVHDPEPVSHFLREHIESGASPRSFDYRIDFDESWALTEWHFGTLSFKPETDL